MKAFLRLLPALLPLLLTACGGREDDTFQLRGQFADMNSGELYLFTDAAGDSRFDTLLVKDGKFAYAGHADRTIELHLFFPNALEQVIFAGPGQRLSYEAKANDLANFRVKGSEENERMNQFRSEAAGQDSAAVRQIARKYILQEPSSPVALHLFKRYFLPAPSAPHAEKLELLDSLLAAQPAERQLLLARTFLEQNRLAQPGDTLPTLAIPLRTQGDTLCIDPANPERPLLIVFWASWMPRNWELLTALREVHRQYNEKDGQPLPQPAIDILAISLDTQIYQWENHVDDADSLAIHHTCDGHAWLSPNVQPFAITQLPTYILADGQAVIQARGTRIEEIKNKVRTLFE